MNPLIQKFSGERRWVLWKLEERNGKKTKLPYQVNSKLASSTDPATWATYAEAKRRMVAAKALSKPYDGIGIVLTSAQTLIAIDLDHVLDEDGKLLTVSLALKPFLDGADTYTEISPSQTGLHLFLETTIPLKLEANRKGNVEIYNSGRYMTVTEDPFGTPKPIRKVTPDEVIALLGKLGYPWNTNSDARITHGDGSSDVLVLEKMFASKHGAKIEALYNGDLSQHDNDASKADAALLAHLAFWCAKDPLQMETIWLASPLGNRKKTQERPDYRVRTIKKAIANCTEVYESQAQQLEKISPGIIFLGTKNKFGDNQPVVNVENVCRILRGHKEFAGTLRYDAFSAAYEYLENGTWTGLEDTVAVDMQTRIQVLYPPFMKVSKEMVYDAMVKVAKDNQIDSAADWVRGLVWDKQDRLNSWLATAYGTPDDEYHRTVGANWMKGLVQRIVSPGSKFDYVLVLEGKQGIGKSVSLMVLGGEWHVETAMSTDNKDFFMQFQGKAIIEFSEGETLSRTEVKRMKAIITTQFDKYRPPYARTSQVFPRRCVFAMTTNQDQYLKDETGNRRWLPVAIKRKVDIQWLKDNRDQLFAEAYHRVTVSKETVYEFPEDEMKRQQDMRETVDPRAGLVYEWYWNKLGNVEREAGVTTREAYSATVQGGSFGKEMGRAEELAIASIFRNVLKLERKQVMKAGLRSCIYYETNESKALAPEVKNEESNVLPSLFEN